MNAVDFAFLATLLFGVFKALVTRRFLSNVFLFAKVLLAFFIALNFSYFGTRILTRLFGVSIQFAPLLSFMMVFIGTVTLLIAAGYVMEMFFGGLAFGSSSKMAGLGLWLLLLTIGFSTLLMLVDNSKVDLSYYTKNSASYQYIRPISDILFCKLSNIAPAVSELVDSAAYIFETLKASALGDCAGEEVTNPTVGR